jgi:N-methylhydantoinase A
MGCALVDVRHDATRTLLVSADAEGFGDLERLFNGACQQLAALLDAERIPPGDRIYERFVTIRYVGQWRSLSIAFAEGQTLGGLLDAFHEQHRREFAYAQEERPVEFFGIRVTGIGKLQKPVLPKLPGGIGCPVASATRRVWFDDAAGFVETPIYQRAEFRAGQLFDGPAIVEQLDSTTVIPPACQVHVEANGSLLLEFTAVLQ